MTFDKDYQLLQRYYREEDPIERLYLFNKIKKRKIDLFMYFTEECSFCDEIVVLRNCQQVALYDKNVSAKMQELRPGMFGYRCINCKQKKKALVDEIREMRRQQLRCRTESGLITDFTTFEILMDSIEALKTRIERANRAKNGMVLSVRDNNADFTMVMSAEKIRAGLVKENIESWLVEEKRKGFLKWSK